MIFQKDKMLYLRTLFFTLIFSCSSLVYAQLNIPDVPQKQTAVYDAADMLSDNEEKQLTEKLIRYADTTSNQIVVVTLNSLNGEYIALFATEWAEKWGIGQKGKDNGAIIMISKDDRKITIQNGFGLEEFLTDYNSKTIIDQIMQPAFKKGNFYRGIDEATTAMFQLLAGQFNAEALNKKSSNGSGLLAFLIPILFVIIVIIIIKRRGGGNGKGGRRSGGLDLFDILILGSFGSRHSQGGGFGGGSSGGSFGGGGFSGGFGGGSFGGGGAVGGW